MVWPAATASWVLCKWRPATCPGREEGSLRRAIAIVTKLTAERPDVSAFQEMLASLHNVLGNLLMDIGNLSDAEESQRHANAIFAKLAKAHPNVPALEDKLAIGRSNLGNLLRKIGDRRAAMESYRQAIVDPDPVNGGVARHSGIGTDWRRASTALGLVQLDARDFRGAGTVSKPGNRTGGQTGGSTPRGPGVSATNWRGATTTSASLQHIDRRPPRRPLNPSNKLPQIGRPGWSRLSRILSNSRAHLVCTSRERRRRILHRSGPVSRRGTVPSPGHRPSTSWRWIGRRRRSDFVNG